MAGRCCCFFSIIVRQAWARGTLLVLFFVMWHWPCSSICCQPGQLHRHGLSFTLKPWAESLPCTSTVHAWPLTTVCNFSHLWLTDDLSWYSSGSLQRQEVSCHACFNFSWLGMDIQPLWNVLIWNNGRFKQASKRAYTYACAVPSD